MKLLSISLSLHRKNELRTHAGVVRILICFGLFASMVVSPSYSQQAIGAQQVPEAKPVPSISTAGQPPLLHIYMHFLLYQNHLDRSAVTREQQGKDGSWLRDHFQQKLGFTSAEFAIVRAAGLRLESELKEIQAETEVVIQELRPSRLANPSKVFPPDPRIEDLIKRREETIQREIAKLNLELGPTAAAKLHAFLENDFLTQENVQAPPRPNLPLPMHSPPKSDTKAVQP